jgi:hypothetical protein
LHETESDHGEEDELMLFEEASGDPLIDGISDIVNKSLSATLVFLLGAFDGFEEEFYKTLEGVLVHMVYYA